jgi:hypothetical protein
MNNPRSQAGSIQAVGRGDARMDHGDAEGITDSVLHLFRRVHIEGEAV